MLGACPAAYLANRAVLYSVAKWRDGRIIEEYVFYDNGTFLAQVGLA